ncbi:MAG: hypothetical protein AMXMBFR84_47460 [Candidatus Hydrogenedentota bacterium]
MSVLTSCIAHRVALFESEAQAVAGDAIHFAPVETGGELYGYRSRGNDIVITFATPPGPNAVHEPCFFRKDLTSLHASHRWIVDNFRLGLWGTWHSHHYLGLSTPSPRDIESAAAIAKKNGMAEFLIFILTIGSNDSHHLGEIREPCSPAARRFRSHGAGAHVCINSFVLRTDSELLSPIPVESIPSASPHRLAFQASGEKAAGLRSDSAPHPSNCICFSTPYFPREESSLPSQLEEELLALPHHLRDYCEVTEQDGQFHVTIRLGPNLKFRLKCDNNRLSERIMSFFQYLSNEGRLLHGALFSQRRGTTDSSNHDCPEAMPEPSCTDHVCADRGQFEGQDEGIPGENQPVDRGSE